MTSLTPLAVAAALALAAGCAGRGRVVDDDPRYHVLYAPGDEYVVTRRVQLTDGSRPRQLHLRTVRQVSERTGSFQGYLDPGARLRVRHVRVHAIEETESQQLFPELTVVGPAADRWRGWVFIPWDGPAGVFGVAGVPTDVLAPHPDYFRKVEPKP